MRGARRIGVLGVDNVLMSDDGIGPFILKILESRYEFPPNVVLHGLEPRASGLHPSSPIMTRLCCRMP